jgi:hypothetical protein
MNCAFFYNHEPHRRKLVPIRYFAKKKKHFMVTKHPERWAKT